jgi:hypothetical protein
MKNANRVFLAAAMAASAAVLLPLSSCGKLDVVGSGSAVSFDALLNALPQAVSFDQANGGWSLAAPDGSARFVWSENFAASPRDDVMIEFDSAPFIDAGLQSDRLPARFALSGAKLAVGTKLGSEAARDIGKPAPLSSYKMLVKLARKSIGYHAALDHYGVNLGDGNLFEWAKNLETNDKDIVFVLDPEPFAAAGVDLTRVDGWLFAKVIVDDENGKPIEVEKLLKPFNLK